MDKDNVFKLMERIISVALTIIMGFIAYQSANWTENIKSLTQSVTELNLQMRGMLTENKYSQDKLIQVSNRLDVHEGEIKNLDRRLIKVEDR